ncbi:hypothetical protein [Paraburkholderia bannensis]|uniref:hypothetical protein n=1 Tax=Paraburkholderia bannensis TaxID=765414 RepID=UPI002ABDAD58|nr:hypothetical protein [Paraburkholderia bannensis]
MSFDFAERDLTHIRNVLGYLERSTDFVRQTEANAVVSLGYWRARVRAIQVMPQLPMHIDKQAKELMLRLDHLESTRQARQSATQSTPGKKAETRSLASMY